MDRINIKNLEVFARHGVLDKEKRQGQVFVISAALYIDLRRAGITDDLSKTIDYGEVCNDIKSFVLNNSFNLIEAIAERLAEKLLVENPALQRIWLEVKKPQAPIAVQLETVSVEIERGRHRVFIGLGSNLGDRVEHLNFAISELSRLRGCEVLKVSNFIGTAPYGYKEQGDFLNGCLEMETLMTPHELLAALQQIENKRGRIRDVRWGPRTLDLDIILYDDIVISDETLHIPHAEMHIRDFVLTPLCEIAPDKLHPILMKTTAELLTKLKIEN